MATGGAGCGAGWHAEPTLMSTRTTGYMLMLRDWTNSVADMICMQTCASDGNTDNRFNPANHLLSGEFLDNRRSA